MHRSSGRVLKKRLGQRIRSFRIERRLNVEKLAAALEVSSEQLDELEAGQRVPPLALLVRLAEELKVELDSLVSVDPKEAPVKHLRKSLRELSALPSLDQDVLSEFLSTIASSMRKLRGAKEKVGHPP